MRGMAQKEKSLLWRRIERTILLCFFDIVAVALAYFFALLLRFDFRISEIDGKYLAEYYRTIPVWCVVTVAVFVVCRLYSSILTMASVAELMTIMRTYALLIPCYILLVFTLNMNMPRSYYVLGLLLSFCAAVCIRFSYRLLRFIRVHEISLRSTKDNRMRVMIIGAGAAGQVLIKELESSDKLSVKVCCVIDDSSFKRGKYIAGVKIVGGRNDIVVMAEKYKIDKIILAIPSASAKQQQEILDICKLTKCKLQTMPGMYQLVNGEVSTSHLRDVEIADLLGREQVQVNNEEILADISGKVVLVTGGGGSIGSELCRQIAAANPKQLVIFDIYENNAYAIQLELKHRHPELNLVVLIGSVRNTKRMNAVMKTYRPEIVFHAAAHKHVPLMEDSPNEAIKNNVLGTYKTAVAAAKYGVKKFVLISTDKAVNPTNIMGASKRLCEMVVQMMDRRSENTSFVAVRFGNVLGSNGSVIPLFQKQIAQGGPVTVTDKRVIRYFMTIPEAVALVLQASYYAKGGEIFVLEMGEPVKIDDMARNLIRLSGYTPDVDIQIVYTGLRPGEKLYEEMLMREEGLQETQNRQIHIGKPIEMDDEWFSQKLQELDEASRNESERMKEIVAEVVPTYQYISKKEKQPASIS